MTLGDKSEQQHRCGGTATSLDGSAVRLATTSPGGPGSCEIDFDIDWRMDGDTLDYVVVGAENLAAWTVEDWDNEQAWSQIPNVRID